MKYYVHDKSDNCLTEYGDWWELITAFYDGDVGYNWHRAKTTYDIGHNDNDVTSEWDYRFSRRDIFALDYEDAIIEKVKNLLTDKNNLYTVNKNHTYAKPLFVYDEYNRIINKRDVKDSLKVYRPELVKPIKRKWRGRYNTGKKKCWSGYRDASWNRNYSAALQEYKDMFPGDARLRRDIDKAGWQWDVEPVKGVQKCWKWQSKKRKQWM